MMLSKIKSSLKGTQLGQKISAYRTWKYHERRKIATQKLAKKWNLSGNPLPGEQKRTTIKEYGIKYNTPIFIETGTYKGETLLAVENLFTTIHSIELDEALYQSAHSKFNKQSHITIHHGDSTNVLPHILQTVKEPCLFWLDGHYSGGITARGTKDTPIIEELTYIFNHPIKNHIILIDDARCFTGKDDYPTLSKLKKFIAKKAPSYTFAVPNDIIRICPK